VIDDDFVLFDDAPAAPMPSHTVGPVVYAGPDFLPIDVELSADDEAYAEAIGQQRHDHSAANGWRNRRVNRRVDDVETDRRGARGEMAVVRAYGVPGRNPLRVAEAIHDPDVAGVDVEATVWTDGRLLLQPDDPDDRPHVLVIIAGNGVYRIPGWLFAFEGKRPEYWDDKLPEPCFAVPQSALRDPRELPIERGN
jgi:hypothetical protein